MEDLQNKILHSQDLDDLYELQLALDKDISQGYRNVALAQTNFEKIDAKGNLTMLYSMRDILLSRIPDLKEEMKSGNNKENRLNYNFRMAAKVVLTKSTFEKIMQLATQTRQEVKQQSKELKKNKTEY